MKKSNSTIFTLDIENVIDWHFQILGKDISDAEKKLFYQVLVVDNASFPENEHIEVVLKAFFSAIHYGSAELKGTNIRSHSVLLNEWLKYRSTIRPSGALSPAKKDTVEQFTYDPDEPLPDEVTQERAIHLLKALAGWRGSQLDDWRNGIVKPLPVGSADNWRIYINKLKQRARGVN
jgi:hypothetical protein